VSKYHIAIKGDIVTKIVKEEKFTEKFSEKIYTENRNYFQTMTSLILNFKHLLGSTFYILFH